MCFELYTSFQICCKTKGKCIQRCSILKKWYHRTEKCRKEPLIWSTSCDECLKPLWLFKKSIAGDVGYGYDKRYIQLSMVLKWCRVFFSSLITLQLEITQWNWSAVVSRWTKSPLLNSRCRIYFHCSLERDTTGLWRIDLRHMQRKLAMMTKENLHSEAQYTFEHQLLEGSSGEGYSLYALLVGFLETFCLQRAEPF